MNDDRLPGRSYGYVIVPQGGLRVDGISYPGGPRAVSKAQHPILVAAGCEPISQTVYEAWLVAGEPSGDGVTDKQDLPITSKPKVRRARKVAVPAAA